MVVQWRIVHEDGVIKGFGIRIDIESRIFDLLCIPEHSSVGWKHGIVWPYLRTVSPSSGGSKRGEQTVWCCGLTSREEK